MSEVSHPLRTGLTRQPELAGIPVFYWAIVASVPMILFIATKDLIDFWGLAAFVITYPAMLYAAKKDAYFAAVLFKSLNLTPATRNKRFWGGNSYGS